MKNRPSIDEYFLKFAMLAAERSTCMRHNIGAVIVRDKHILSTGYNGAPKNTRDCTELGCLRDELKIPSGTQQQICRAVHAEQNAIIQAAYHGVSIKDATIYCTHNPCIICAKMIVNAGISRVVSYQKYHDDSFVGLFLEAGVKFEIHDKPVNTIVELDKVMLYNDNKEVKSEKIEEKTEPAINQPSSFNQINMNSLNDSLETGENIKAEIPI